MAKGKNCDIGLDDRCRDLDGEIRQRRGDTLHALSAVSTPSLTALLSAYGPLSPQLPTTGLGKALSAPAVKRKVYFAFRFKDIMRVNNVRQSGKIGFDEDKNPRDFYDRSIWEKRAIDDPESLKRL